MDRSQKAKEIIARIPYITIATASSDAQPWNTPVLAVTDEKYNFYWVSWFGTQHSMNIKENPSVFLVIYDSTVSPGSGEGVYIKATASELSEPYEIDKIAALIYGKKAKEPRKVDEFLGENPRRIYKATPQQTWVNLDVDVKGSIVDTRKEITL